MNDMPGIDLNTQNPQIYNREDPVTSHSNKMPFLNAVGPNILPHGVLMGPDMMSHNTVKDHLSCGPQIVSQGQMGFPRSSL